MSHKHSRVLSASDAIGPKLLGALGVSTEDVYSATIKIAVGEAILIEIQRYAAGDPDGVDAEIEALRLVASHYRLEEIKLD